MQLVFDKQIQNREKEIVPISKKTQLFYFWKLKKSKAYKGSLCNFFFYLKMFCDFLKNIYFFNLQANILYLTLVNVY